MPHLVEIDGVDMRYGGASGTLAVSGLDLKVKKASSPQLSAHPAVENRP